MQNLLGIGLCLGEENDDLFYIPLGHQTKKETPNQLSIEDVFSKLRTWIEDPKKEKALQNSKFDRQIFFNHGLCLLYTSPSPRDSVVSRMPSSA